MKETIGWQLKETLPSDGSVVIIRTNRKGIVKIVPAIFYPKIDKDYPWSILDEDWGVNALPDTTYVTHWAHMPTGEMLDED